MDDSKLLISTQLFSEIWIKIQTECGYSGGAEGRGASLNLDPLSQSCRGGCNMRLGGSGLVGNVGCFCNGRDNNGDNCDNNYYNYYNNNFDKSILDQKNNNNKTYY